ncbi:MAG: ATP/GTP-binding protein [Anaerolineales bacterium]
MLIRFSVENFLSFNNQVEFSMVPGLVRKHKNHIIYSEKPSGINILKGAVIYGANASGKSNLIKAVAFARNLIVYGVEPNYAIPIKCFKLEESCYDHPSKFQFEFKTNENYYIYGFEISEKFVYSEWLYKTSKNTQKLLFERRTTEDGETNIEFGNLNYDDRDDRLLVRITGRQTRNNQLFLTESIDRNISHFEDVHRWFREVLVTIEPESIYSGYGVSSFKSDDLGKDLVNYISLFDTGIKDINLKDIDEIRKKSIPNEILNSISNELKKNDTDEYESFLISSKERFFITYEDNNLRIKSFAFEHNMREGSNGIFLDINEESDGTKRLLDLVPVLIATKTSNSVFLIDELDRSLHPSICYKFFELFFQNIGSESQLIATTHESSLLDLDLFRRDEIWFVEKNKFGESTIYSLEEFAPRYDKDIRRGYLNGRFGAIPILRNPKDLGWE